MKLIVLALCLFTVPVSAQNLETVFRGRDVLFEPLVTTPMTPATWTFRVVDDAVSARVVIDGQGSYFGGQWLTGADGRQWRFHGVSPNGSVDLELKAQDEAIGIGGEVASSNLFAPLIRAMSRSFGSLDAPPYHPSVGHCRGTQCPEMLEFYSPKHVRFTAASNGSVSFIASNKEALLVRPDGVGGADYFLQLLGNNVDWNGGPAYLCLTAQRQVYASESPCR